MKKLVAVIMVGLMLVCGANVYARGGAGNAGARGVNVGGARGVGGAGFRGTNVGVNVNRGFNRGVNVGVGVNRFNRGGGALNAAQINNRFFNLNQGARFNGINPFFNRNLSVNRFGFGFNNFGFGLNTFGFNRGLLQSNLNINTVFDADGAFVDAFGNVHRRQIRGGRLIDINQTTGAVTIIR